TATAVTKTTVSGSPGKISLKFTGTRPAPLPGGTAGTGSQTDVWNMTEPYSVPGQMSGTWVSTDHRRMFTYDDRYTFLFHMGVNGLPTLQDACFIVNDDGTSTLSSGYITRHAGSTFNCLPGGSATATRDIPFYTTSG